MTWKYNGKVWKSGIFQYLYNICKCAIQVSGRRSIASYLPSQRYYDQVGKSDVCIERRASDIVRYIEYDSKIGLRAIDQASLELVIWHEIDCVVPPRQVSGAMFLGSYVGGVIVLFYIPCYSVVRLLLFYCMSMYSNLYISYLEWNSRISDNPSQPYFGQKCAKSHCWMTWEF